MITLGGFNRSVLQYKIKRLGADENGVGVLVTTDSDLPADASAGHNADDVADDGTAAS